MRRYTHLLDKDYTKNKITICANLSNLYNSFTSRVYKASGSIQDRSYPQQLNNFFDFEKWQNEYQDEMTQEWQNDA